MIQIFKLTVQFQTNRLLKLLKCTFQKVDLLDTSEID